MPVSDREYFRYLPVSDEDRRWGLFVTGVGCTSVPPFSPSYPVSVHPHAYQFHWEKGRVLHEYQFLYILRGDGEFESRTAGHLPVPPGSLLLLFPGEWHRYRPRREVGWDEFWISFQGRHIDDLVQQGLLSPREPVWGTGPDEAMVRSYRAALERVQHEPIGFQRLIAVEVQAILAAAWAARRRQRSTSRGEAIVREAKTVLEQGADQPTSIARLAARFHLSEKHFRRLFQQHTGLSPYQYYLQLRIHRAQDLLRGTTLSIKEVAAALDFETPFHFSTLFKKKTGQSPSQWRRGGP